jgi:hypothetical protein
MRCVSVIVVTYLALFIDAAGFAQESHKEETEPKVRDAVEISEFNVNFPPMSRQSIDYLFDSLRSGGAYQAPEPQTSQVVPSNVPGFWAGTRASLDSEVGAITLRFKPTDQARLDSATSRNPAAALLDSVDVELSLDLGTFTIRPLKAENPTTRAGLVVKLLDSRITPVLTEFVKGFNNSGMYFSWPPVTRAQARKAWSLLICPRVPRYVQERGTKYSRLELLRSPYELKEAYFSISGSVSSRMSPGEKPERIAITILPTGNMPKAGANRDEVRSLSPKLEVLYRPMSEFKFFKIPPLDGHVQEGILAKIETQNAAGYIRRQYQSHVVYIHRLDEPSPVPVIIGDYKAARDEGSCYIVSAQRNVWNEYDRVTEGVNPQNSQ